MKVETYKIKGWKNLETGLLIDENAKWILVKHISGDYLVDGYKVYNKNTVLKRMHKKDEKLKEKVLSLKKVEAKKPKGFKFGSMKTMLEWSEKKYGLFEFQDFEEEVLFYGKIKKIDKELMRIHMIEPNGKLKKNFDYDFSLKDIQALVFESDYFNSIRLLMQDKKK